MGGAVIGPPLASDATLHEKSGQLPITYLLAIILVRICHTWIHMYRRVGLDLNSKKSKSLMLDAAYYIAQSSVLGEIAGSFAWRCYGRDRSTSTWVRPCLGIYDIQAKLWSLSNGNVPGPSSMFSSMY